MYTVSVSSEAENDVWQIYYWKFKCKSKDFERKNKMGQNLEFLNFNILLTSTLITLCYDYDICIYCNYGFCS